MSDTTTQASVDREDRSEPRQSPRRHVLRWSVGFVLATALIWSTVWFFLDTILPHILDPTVECYIAPAGSRYRFRSEGWAVTSYGNYGIPTVSDLSHTAAPRVAFWGDSFVEAPHVADADKMAQQVTTIWRRRHGSQLLGLGIGRGGRTVADYYFLIPRYEEITTFLCHFVIMGSLRDVCPDGTWFLTEPEYRFVPRLRHQPMPALRRVLDRYHLEFLWGSFWSLLGEKRNPLTRTPIRFRPGPVPPQPQRHIWSWQDLAGVKEADWEFAITALSSRSERPLVFLYAPRLPYIDGGEVLTGHPARMQAARFAAACRRHGIDFLDLSAQFAAFYRETGRFPIGFANSQLGKGHYNRHGHQLIAAAVCDYIEERFPEVCAARNEDHVDHAVHPD